MRQPPSAVVRRTVAAALVAGFGVAVWTTAPTRAQPADTPGDGPKPIGSAGCASANCHGQPTAELARKPGADAWKYSLTAWSAFDPHTNATAVLDPKRNPTAARMLAAFRKSDPKFDPQTDARCLACHTTPALAVLPAGDPRVGFRADGVGCEACHGSAERWQVPHYQWDTPEQRKAGIEKSGMTDLNDHAVRAKHCAGCHVGAPAGNGNPVRDMNHDMIAAGHPRLIFDYPTHLLRLPKHWQEKDRTQAGTPARPAGDELTAWVAGQLAAAEAQCELTADRATRKSPWPELADFNCYSCHHDLVPKSWRVKVGPIAGHALGKPGFDLPWPVADLAGEAAAEPLKAVNAGKSPESVKVAAEKLAALLRTVAKGDAAAAIRAAVTATTKPDRPLSWDDAYRAYLALNALDLYRPAYPNHAAVRKGLDDLGGKLLALPGHPTEGGYTPDEVKKRLAELLAQIP